MSSSITLTLPYPISANRYWRTYMPKGFKAPVTTISAEAKEFKAEVAKIARASGVVAPLTGRVAVSYVLYPNRPQDWKRRAARDPHGWEDSVQCIDLDNAQKVLLDALKGVVIEDDRWVRRIEADRVEPDGVGRLVVTVRPIVVAKPQLALIP